jgi:two-component system alkaline phosphatase synthesis response regulator PhoP
MNDKLPKGDHGDMLEAAKRKILVVDDEEDVRDFLQAVLEDAGFEVETAADGEDALFKVRANPPDAISLDLVMPRKSGAKFLREIRKDESLQHIPVVLVTAHAKDNLGRQDFEDLLSGEDIRKPESYLEKPVKADAYVNTINMALESSSVKTLVSHSVSASDPDKVKDELKDLIDGADPKKLAEALEILKKKK